MQLDRIILSTFIYEENTIVQVENHIRNRLQVVISRDEVKNRLIILLDENYISLFDSPLHNSIDFKSADEEFIEDFWFNLTPKGRDYLNNNIE